MPVSIRVRNFQSIADAAVEVEGFTVVTGPNNSGKSALQRAVRAAFQNARGSAFVRRGTTKASVEIDFHDGHSFRWEKGVGKDAKPTYVIDGGAPIHPGQGIPDELADMGVRPVMAGGKQFWPQFAPQFTGQVFLLDEPGSVLAEAVADVDRVGKINAALKLAESDRRAAASELKVRKADIERIGEALGKFDGIEDVAVMVADLERDRKQAARIETALDGLEKLRSDHAAAVASVARLSGVETVEIPEDDIFANAAALAAEIVGLGALSGRLNAAGGKVSRFAGLDAVELEFDLEGLSRVAAAVGVLEGLAARLGAATIAERSAKEEVDHAVLEAEEADLAVARFLDEIGTCPYCGALTTGTSGPAGGPEHGTTCP